MLPWSILPHLITLGDLCDHCYMEEAKNAPLSFPGTPEQERFLTEAIVFHRSHPEVSLNQHILNSSLFIGQMIASRRRVYLDMKYWIICCEVILGRSREPKHQKLYDLLLRFVNEGKIICPISDYCWLELFKQQDAKTLCATARAIDQLSNGVCITFHHERIAIELLHFLREKTPSGNAYPLVNLVWTRVSNAIGTAIGINRFLPEGLSPPESLAIKKALYDLRWNMSMSEIVRDLYNPQKASRLSIDVSPLNEGRIAHAGEINSFYDAWNQELAGTVDIYVDTFRTVLENYFGAPIDKIKIDDDIHKDVTKYFQSFIFAVFKQGKVTTEMPFINIQAGIHAATRWDKQRKIKANDIWDFGHAAAALPYYNLFLTENSLKHLVTSPPLCYDKLYGVKVIADEDEAIAALESL